MSGHAPPVAWPASPDDRSRPFRFALLGGPLLTGGGEEIPLSPYQTLLLLLVFGHGDRGLSRTRAARYLWGTELDSGARHRLSQLLHAIKRRTGGAEVVRRRGEGLLPNSLVVAWDAPGRGDGEDGPPQELLPLLPADLPTRDLEEWVYGLRVAHERRREAVLQSPSTGPTVPFVRESDLRRSLPAQRGTASLVGRRSELASALAAISGEPPRWTTVVVSGEAGIGKTRLLDAIQEALAERGREATFIRCHEAERLIAFNLLADLWTNRSFASASGALPDPWRGILRTTFPGMAGAPSGQRDVSPSRSSPLLPRRVFDAIERGFALAVPAEGLDILIDDFHWSDPGSAAALGFLRRRLPDLGVRIVLTVPSHAAPLDHPASAYLRALDGRRDHWITLEPLGGDEIGSLIGSTYPKAMSDHEIREISTLSGGVPLFAVELANDRAARSEAPPDATTTRSAEALFRRRQASLSPTAEHLLRLLAVFRRPVPLEVLEAASRLDPARFADATGELTRQRLVDVDGEGRLATRHEMLRGAVYQALPAEARRIYHRTVAECLLGFGAPPEPGEVATHFQRGRAPLLAHRYATAAADEASRKGAFQECRQMLELAAATASDPTRRFEALDRLGRLCLLQSEPGAAAAHLLAAEKSARAVGDIAHALDARIRAIGALLEIGERTGPSLQEELEELASTCLAHGYLATYLDAKDLSIRVADYGFDAPAARAALDDVDRLDVGGESPSVRCLRETIRTRHICYGNPDEAVLAARRALRIAEDHRLAMEFGRAVKRFLVVLGYRGMLDGDEGRRLVEEAKVGFRRSGNQSGLFDVLINLGVWLVDTGRYLEAEEYLAEAGRIVHNLEDSPEHGVFMCNMGEFHLYQADYLTAKRYFLRAWERGALTRRATRCAVAGGLGLCSVQTGDLGLAGELDRALPDDASFLGNPTVDPTPVALFRARRLEVRQSPEAAARLLHLYGESLRDRIVPAWLKVLLAELRLRRKHNLGGVGGLAEEGREAAERLGLVVREREFAAYAS